MDFNQENFDKDKLPSDLDNGLIFFKNSINLNKGNFDKSKYTAKKTDLPQNLNLLDTIGVEFAKYKSHANKFFLPYSVTILGKLERFINLGHFPFYFEQKGNEFKLLERKPTLPHERVRFFSSRVGDYGTIPWKYNHETDFILINIDYPKKGETFVLANLERFAFKSSDTISSGGKIVKKGFSIVEYNKEGKIVSSENLQLYEGTIGLLTDEIVRSVTKQKANYINNRDYDNYNIREYINIANFIRNFVNENKSSTEGYELKKDALIYDLFVNKNLTETQRVICSKCPSGTFELMIEMINNLKYSKDIFEFKKQYSNLLKLFRWMKKSSK